MSQQYRQYRTSARQQLHPSLLTRGNGDGDRYHCAARDGYTGAREHWRDARAAEKKAAIAATATRKP